MKYISTHSNYQLIKDQKDFINFKYSGGTDSLTYEYIWGPLAEKLVDITPQFIAPNLITLTSLVLISVTHLIFMFWGDNQQGIPTWKLVLMTVSTFIYQNLDNLDGKQARKTKTGSPLGMLFDHGVDSVVSFLLGIQFLEIIQIKKHYVVIIALYVFIMLVFFSAIFNQYSTGVFKLGRINPVDQGLPALALSALFSSFFNLEQLNQQHWFGSYNQQILIGLAAILIVQLISMNKDIFKNAVRPKNDVIQTLCLPFIAGFILIYTGIMQKDIYYERIGKSVAYSLMFFWSRNMIEIQLYYIANQRFNVFNIGTNVFIFTHMGYLLLSKFLSGYGITPELYFGVVTFINFLVFFEFVWSVLRQGSQILGINIFTIKKKCD